MADGRWDWLEGVRAETALDALAREAGRALAEEVATWPPQLAWLDAGQAAAYAPLLAEGAPPPSAAAVRAGFQLARWELSRDEAALDHALRTGDVMRATSGDALAARLLWRWTTEWLYALRERVVARLTRAHLVAALDHAEARLGTLAGAS